MPYAITAYFRVIGKLPNERLTGFITTLFILVWLFSSVLTSHRTRKLGLVEIFCTVFISVAAYVVLWNASGSLWSALYFNAIFLFAPAYILISFRNVPVLNSLPVRAFGLLFGMAFALNSIVQTMPFWRSGGINDQQALGISKFLLAPQLHYGYAGYFEALANTVSWISKGDVIIRPISFIAPSYRAEPSPGLNVSQLWSKPSDQTNKRNTFIIVSQSAQYPHVQDCVRGAETQFGRPAQTLTFSAGPAYTVLVWNHPLLPQLTK
ncbi:hypothetical protein [Acidocella aminolytica]|uniref:Uncharacterized protein n=1 Tax=Acidocella aminolytica 101 = DSM 11237 TaxID=1120923 RepID=A0A0D6PD35_9PROT|nr:hypothetical protein [Acidocella aminolytica]GAN79655.1 hypothetical protein Aam_025_043 [Acidocella aminolytica 101 = DSM 11237]SHF05397.1 hypothetical protein SAMN02746095_01969 [Acidocella aminolytica 101 = DSM 11237]